MEYVNQHGAFDDMPLDQIVQDFRRVYGDWMTDAGSALQATSFASDTEKKLANARCWFLSQISL